MLLNLNMGLNFCLLLFCFVLVTRSSSPYKRHSTGECMCTVAFMKVNVLKNRGNQQDLPIRILGGPGTEVGKSRFTVLST